MRNDKNRAVLFRPLRRQVGDELHSGDHLVLLLGGLSRGQHLRPDWSLMLESFDLLGGQRVEDVQLLVYNAVLAVDALKDEAAVEAHDALHVEDGLRQLLEDASDHDYGADVLKPTW